MIDRDFEQMMSEHGNCLLIDDETGEAKPMKATGLFKTRMEALRTIKYAYLNERIYPFNQLIDFNLENVKKYGFAPPQPTTSPNANTKNQPDKPCQ